MKMIRTLSLPADLCRISHPEIASLARQLHPQEAFREKVLQEIVRLLDIPLKEF